MQVQVSPEVGELLDDAVAISVRRGKYYVGVEHLFEAAVSTPARLPDRFTERYAAVLHQAVGGVYRNAWQGTPPSVDGEVFYTPRCAAITHEASHLARRLQSGSTTVGHVLLAILGDAFAGPSRVLNDLVEDRSDLIKALRDELVADAAPQQEEVAADKQATPAVENESASPSSGTTPETETKKVCIEHFTRDLTELASQGKLSLPSGRDDELMAMIEVLARQGKHNVMLIGDPGTGKTKLLEGLACCLAQGRFGEIIKQRRILELNIAAMMSGTQFRGSFEDKVFALIEELHWSEDTILFIDEIHLMMGAGSTDEDSMDLANILKPALGRGELRCIGATTLKEYRKFITKDPAIERRFQTVRVEELSADATLEVLRDLQPTLEMHHNVSIKDSALQAAIRLSERYLPNRNLPDKAIDIVDQACARHRISVLMSSAQYGNEHVSDASSTVTTHTVRQVISQITTVPVEAISQEERLRIAELDQILAERVIGQDEAIGRVVAAVKKSRVGLADPNRPDGVFLFVGPTGVGKTQLAKELAKQIFGSADDLIRFDMSEYVEPHSVSRLIGAPPGYVGHGEEGLLTGAVKDKPFSILLFDEIEKAHPKVFDVFLPILDEGRMKDADGQVVSFRNTLIIFTSNVAAELLGCPGETVEESEIIEALQGRFRPEFINRIDEIVPFYPLLFEDLRLILKTMIDGLRLRARDQHLGIRMYQRAYEFLAEKGYSPAYGARELRRAVERYVANPISELILQGVFEPGDMIDVKMEKGEITHRKGKPRKSKRLTLS